MVKTICNNWRPPRDQGQFVFGLRKRRNSVSLFVFRKIFLKAFFVFDKLYELTRVVFVSFLFYLVLYLFNYSISMPPLSFEQLLGPPLACAFCPYRGHFFYPYFCLHCFTILCYTCTHDNILSFETPAPYITNCFFCNHELPIQSKKVLFGLNIRLNFHPGNIPFKAYLAHKSPYL